MSISNHELFSIIKTFADSEWDLIDAPAKAWLNAKEDPEKSKTATIELIDAVKKADVECGNCGCEMDPLYKKALKLLEA